MGWGDGYPSKRSIDRPSKREEFMAEEYNNEASNKIKSLEAKLQVAVEALESIQKMRDRNCDHGCTCVFDHAYFTLEKIKAK